MNQFNYDSFKRAKLPPVWPRNFLIFIFLIFLLTGAGAYGLDYWNKTQGDRLEAMGAEYEVLRETFSLGQEQEIALFEKKLANLEKLLGSHVYFSKVLALLEEITHPHVYYTSLEYSLESNALDLNGVAQNQQALSEAMNGFVNNSQNIKMAILRNMKMNSDKTAQFHLELVLQPQVLKY